MDNWGEIEEDSMLSTSSSSDSDTEETLRTIQSYRIDRQHTPKWPEQPDSIEPGTDDYLGKPALIKLMEVIHYDHEYSVMRAIQKYGYNITKRDFIRASLKLLFKKPQFREFTAELMFNDTMQQTEVSLKWERALSYGTHKKMRYLLDHKKTEYQKLVMLAADHYESHRTGFGDYVQMIQKHINWDTLNTELTDLLKHYFRKEHGKQQEAATQTEEPQRKRRRCKRTT